ncbi:MAG: thioredoxin-dependent thiol peroxidase [Candidatus Diapherotrites archaeon]|nr:thioredoxin-dependent thiol peroxidase [Candidatus Diapherotrites archaeon]
MISEGAKAPNFSLKNQKGETIKLSDFKGKKVVLYFYPKDDTPGCTVEACGFRDAYKELKKAGITVLGVSKDSEQSHKKFEEKFKLNFSLLSDPEGETCRAYDSLGEKTFFGKKSFGIFRNSFLINEQGLIVKIFQKVNPLGHEKQILEEFAKL